MVLNFTFIQNSKISLVFCPELPSMLHVIASDQTPECVRGFWGNVMGA